MISVFRDVSRSSENGVYIVTISDVEGEVVPPIFYNVDFSTPGVSERLDLNDAYNLAEELKRKLIEQHEPDSK